MRLHLVVVALALLLGPLTPPLAQTPVTPARASSAVEFVRGTVAVDAATLAAVGRALGAAQVAGSIPLARYYSVASVRATGEARLLSIVGLDRLDAGVGWRLGDAVWTGLALVAAGRDGALVAGVEGTVTFSRLLDAVPEGVISRASKAALDPRARAVPATSTPYRFPWDPGYDALYGEYAVHSGGQAGWVAVDFMSDGATAAGHAPNRVRAMAAGTIGFVCVDATQVSFQLGDLWYLHLIYNDGIAPGAFFQQGQELGQLKVGSFDDQCGYALQSPNWFHLHVAFEDTGSWQVEGWTLDTVDQLWRRDGEIRQPWFPGENGESWLPTCANLSGSWSTSLPLVEPGGTVSVRGDGAASSGWHEGQAVHASLLDGHDDNWVLGDAIVGCESGQPWLHANFTVPAGAAPGSGLLTLEHGGTASFVPITLGSAEVDRFYPTWARTDRPIEAGQANRTWMWGPEPFSGDINEPYAESPEGQRVVRYYDKSRMEITDPAGDPDADWFVTNGLLVVEMVTGRLQLGDNAFDDRQPAGVNVAGDADDPDGPTYATFAGLLDAPALTTGATIDQVVDRGGDVTHNPALADYGAVVAIIEPTTSHSIAAPFWELMTSTGLVYEDGDYLTAPLFLNPYYATGLPISEPYWASVLLAGVPTDVLLQCFERRCLTWTPGNPPGWEVEAGNVGLHYYFWRHGALS